MRRNDFMEWTPIWALLAGLAILAVLHACSTTPEALLKRSYDSISATSQLTTAALTRDRITVDQAHAVYRILGSAKTVLDGGKEELKACRAKGDTACTDAKAKIQLGTEVLDTLEKEMEAFK